MCSQHRPRSKSGPSSLPRLCFPLPILLLLATCCALGMDAPMLCTASAPQLLVHRIQPRSQLPPAALGGPARGTTNTASSSRSPQCLLPIVPGLWSEPTRVEGTRRATAHPRTARCLLAPHCRCLMAFGPRGLTLPTRSTPAAPSWQQAKPSAHTSIAQSSADPYFFLGGGGSLSTALEWGRMSCGHGAALPHSPHAAPKQRMHRMPPPQPVHMQKTPHTYSWLWIWGRAPQQERSHTGMWHSALHPPAA